MLSDESICILGDNPSVLRLRFSLEDLVVLEALFMSKSLKEASFLGATFLVGLAAMQAMLHLAGF